MYTNQRRALSRISDDSVMRDVMTETRDLYVSILRVGASQMRLSHVVPISSFVKIMSFVLNYYTLSSCT
jgi:hypothetical protein